MVAVCVSFLLFKLVFAYYGMQHFDLFTIVTYIVTNYFLRFVIISLSCNYTAQGPFDLICRIPGNAPTSWINVDKRLPRRVFALCVDSLYAVRKHCSIGVLDYNYTCMRDTDLVKRFKYQARPGVLGIRYLKPFLFRYMVFFWSQLGCKVSCFSWILGILLGSV